MQSRTLTPGPPTDATIPNTVLVAGATSFGEKCGGQCQGASNAEPDARMKTGMKKPPTSSGCRDEREDTEADLNLRFTPNHER
jgi:hypothetical protein